MENKAIKVGITVGDINGVGLEVIIKTFREQDSFTNTIPIIYGSSKVISAHKKALNTTDFNVFPIKSAEEAKEKKIKPARRLHKEHQ